MRSNATSYEYWNSKSTEEIIESLKPGSPDEPLTVKGDGSVMQGNTRLLILEQRGVDTTNLPRDILPDEFIPE